MTFWLFNELVFDDPEKEEARRQRAEKKRQERIKARRVEDKRRQAEMDKLRDSAGAYSSKGEKSFDQELDELIDKAKKNPQPQSKGIQGAGLSSGFGGGAEVKTGYQHGRQPAAGPHFGAKISMPGVPCATSSNPVSGGGAGGFGAGNGKIPRPF